MKIPSQHTDQRQSNAQTPRHRQEPNLHNFWPTGNDNTLDIYTATMLDIDSMIFYD